MTATGADGTDRRVRGSALEVFVVFLKLGLTSFGGPIAHLGYFRHELVARRKWLDDAAYADLVALCQFLPGPASSQVGFALGLGRAGWAGAFAAFVAFTLPSAILLVTFGVTAPYLAGPVGAGILHGLKIVAVAIVAQAVWGMSQSLCPDRERATIAVGAVVAMAFLPGVAGMLAALALGAVAGAFLRRAPGPQPAGHAGMNVSPPAGLAALCAFALLLILLPALAGLSQGLALFDAFYRSGAMVFGGGHVVLPLLEAEVVSRGWVTADDFLVGYGAAQAVPGPLFTFAAYLGAVSGAEPNGIVGAAVALVGLFLPGFLILIAALPFWEGLRARPAARAAMAGANAAVVGILGAALFDPVMLSAIGNLRDLALAMACFVLLVAWKLPPFAVVLLAVAGGVGLAVLV